MGQESRRLAGAEVGAQPCRAMARSLRGVCRLMTALTALVQTRQNHTVARVPFSMPLGQRRETGSIIPDNRPDEVRLNWHLHHSSLEKATLALRTRSQRVRYSGHNEKICRLQTS